MTDTELRRLAEAATPWENSVTRDGCAECDRRGTSEWFVSDVSGGYHATFSDETQARLIAAANPAAIIALLDRVERAEAVWRDPAAMHINLCRTRILTREQLLHLLGDAAQTEAAASARRAALEEAAKLVETHACATIGGEKVMEPSKFAIHDQHHACIAKAIRDLAKEG